jgi:hypothetical protein
MFFHCHYRKLEALQKRCRHVSRFLGNQLRTRAEEMWKPPVQDPSTLDLDDISYLGTITRVLLHRQGSYATW